MRDWSFELNNSKFMCKSIKVKLTDNLGNDINDAKLIF